MHTRNLSDRLFVAVCAVGALVGTVVWSGAAFLLAFGVVASREPLAAAWRSRAQRRIAVPVLRPRRRAA
jgi:hypothetical protein